MTIISRRSLSHLSAASLAVLGLSTVSFAATDPAAQPAAPAEGQAPATTPAPGAQGPGTAQQPPAIQGEVTDQQLEQFAAAAAEVQQIQQDYAAKAQTLQKNTEEQIVASVQDAGMSVAEFTALVERLQTDPALARRLDGMQTEAE